MSVTVRSESTLAEAIRARAATVGVIGLGYVGLPLAREFSGCGRGFPVLGFDIDPDKVAMLQDGRSYMRHILDQDVRDMRHGGFEATADYRRVAEADAVVICVPTPLGPHQEPDLSCVEDTCQAVASALRPGQLIVLESTTYPGTTREVVLPRLEAGGLRVGEDFFLGYSPEREDPGNPDHGMARIPKVVSGVTPACRRLTQLLYDQVVACTVPVSSPDAAEAAKLLENIYRSVNIALVNELKTLFHRMDIDIFEVISAAATKPFGFQAFYPGPGLGGHCIPIDPFYLSWRAREFGHAARFIHLAGEINTAMPEFVVSRVADVLNRHGHTVSGASILVLGVAYKADVDDTRESPAFRLMELLEGQGARIDYSDPHVPHLRPTRHYDFHKDSVPLTPEALESYDCILISTAHSAVDYDIVHRHARLIVDTRNVYDGPGNSNGKVFKA